MFNFTKQKLTSAVIPLQTGGTGIFENPNPHEEEYGDQQYGSGELAINEQWLLIWGAYSFTEPDGSKAVIEGSGMVQTYMHDFCGGSLGSSFGVYLHEQNAKDMWGSRTKRLSLRAPRGSGTWCDEHYAVLPELLPALSLPPDYALTREDAKEIMRRSLMFWALGFLVTRGRRALFGVDRVENDHNAAPSSRPVWSTVHSIKRVPNCIVRTSSLNLGPKGMLGLAPDRDMRVEGMNGARLSSNSALFKSKAKMYNGNSFRNYNSGAEVASMEVQLIVDDASEDSDEDREEVYDEDTDRYIIVSPGMTPFTLPPYFVNKASTAGYMRMFPRALFTA